LAHQVELAEIRSTVKRMEKALSLRDEELIQTLMGIYDKLVPRFAEELKNERDELFSRGGALMQTSLHWVPYSLPILA
ncbi:MAG: hypothetical protein ACYCPP_07415, partial [Nitrososphaerales archaeon]